MSAPAAKSSRSTTAFTCSATTMSCHNHLWGGALAPPARFCAERPRGRRFYFWMQVSAVSLVHSSRPVNTGSSTVLPVDQVDHHRRRLVAHLERTLADQRGHQPFLGDRHFVADRVGGADDEVVAGDLVLADRLEQVAIGLRRAEQRPAALMPKASSFGIGGEDVGHRLHALGAVVIGEDRAAGDFGPAAFALQRRRGPSGRSARRACPGRGAGCCRRPACLRSCRSCRRSAWPS